MDLTSVGNLKTFTLVNYGSRVVITSKLLITFGEAL